MFRLIKKSLTSIFIAITSTTYKSRLFIEDIQTKGLATKNYLWEGMSRRSNPKFDVFVSYHGGDTGTNFTNHLAAAVKRRGIGMYRVDVDIPRGMVIWNELMEAIEASRVAVIVFSKNYASSTWCLDEVRKVMSCNKYFKTVVLPIFYNVSPSDVRQQNENFVIKIKDDNDSRLKRWKSALTQAANLVGLDLKPNR